MTLGTNDRSPSGTPAGRLRHQVAVVRQLT